MTSMTIKEIIDRIFKEPGIKCELKEFDTFGQLVHETLEQAKSCVEQLIDEAVRL